MTVDRTFFGHMIQGSLLTSPEKVTIPIGTLRIWNDGASLEWVYRNNWQGFDQAIAFGKAKGCELLHVLAGEPNTELPPIQDWRAFVTAAVARAAGRIKYWQPLNEPAYLKNANPGIARVYAEAAATIIKADDRRHVILSPSFNELQKDFERGFAQEYIDLMAAMGHSCDAVAFHSYSGDPERDRQTLLSLLNPHAFDLPIWLTETVATMPQLEQLSHTVACVVQNAQIAGAGDYDATTGKGLAWKQAYNELTSPGKPSWWRRFLLFLHLVKEGP